MKLADLKVREVRRGVAEAAPVRVSRPRKPGGNLTFIKHQIPVDWAGVERDRGRARELGGEFLRAFNWWESQYGRRG